ncbi:MAG TPA: FadR/GntR family transcriptional regulator [Gaiellaceae bacterium]|jgi:GntR family transcriptional repressor for pyruvate dehydrogenase complex
MTTFETVKRSAAAQEAVRQLQELVRSGELSPGQRLPPERTLAQQLGVSRSTLREAIRALVVMNILVSRHGTGTYVSSLEPELLAEPFQFIISISDEALLHLFEIRKVIEPACARLAAERIDETELAELDRILDDSEAALDDPEELLDRDVELHAVIVRATRNPLLMQIMSGIGGLALAGRRKTVVLPGMAERSVAEHREIVASLREHDSEAAAAAMTAHLVRIERSFRQQKEGVPG